MKWEVAVSLATHAKFTDMGDNVNFRIKPTRIKNVLISMIIVITFFVNLTLVNIRTLAIAPFLFGLSCILMISVMRYKIDPK